MRIVIAGGSGLLGRALAARLIGNGHEVVNLSRRASGQARRGYREVSWNPDGSTGPWASELASADAVVNIAGAGIADKRWTKARKAELRASRLDSTRSLISAMQATSRAPVFIQGSAVGYYGASLDDAILDEQSPPGHDFLARLAVEWEDAASPAAALGCRLVVIRTGIVLASEGGALPPMARPFRLFAGGPVGTGRQYMSWVTSDDWVSLVVWAISAPQASGPLNATAPAPVTNAELGKAIGRVLGRPSWLPVPAFVLRTALGEMADALLLSGQRVLPTRTTSLGFAFSYFDLHDALVNVFRS